MGENGVSSKIHVFKELSFPDDISTGWPSKNSIYVVPEPVSLPETLWALRRIPVTRPPLFKSHIVISPLSIQAVAIAPANLPSSPAPMPSVRKEMDVIGATFDEVVLSGRITLLVSISTIDNAPFLYAMATKDKTGVG